MATVAALWATPALRSAAAAEIPLFGGNSEIARDLMHGEAHLLILGDAAHHPVHLEHLDWIPAVDLDPAESSRLREKMCALAVERDAVVTGGHFPILTRGHVRRVEGGYRWEPL